MTTPSDRSALIPACDTCGAIVPDNATTPPCEHAEWSHYPPALRPAPSRHYGYVYRIDPGEWGWQCETRDPWTLCSAGDDFPTREAALARARLHLALTHANEVVA